MPASARTASNEAVNCPARSPTRNSEPCGAVAEIHQQIPELLHGPGPVQVGGHAEDVHVSGADLHDEEAVQALGYRAVDVEEVPGQHRRYLGVQELPPCGVGLPLRRWRDLQGLEDPAGRRGTDPVAELE